MPNLLHNNLHCLFLDSYLLRKHHMNIEVIRCICVFHKSMKNRENLVFYDSFMFFLPGSRNQIKRIYQLLACVHSPQSTWRENILKLVCVSAIEYRYLQLSHPCMDTCTYTVYQVYSSTATLSVLGSIGIDIDMDIDIDIDIGIGFPLGEQTTILVSVPLVFRTNFTELWVLQGEEKRRNLHVKKKNPKQKERAPQHSTRLDCSSFPFVGTIWVQSVATRCSVAMGRHAAAASSIGSKASTQKRVVRKISNATKGMLSR